jgi:hypothetical protein
MLVKRHHLFSLGLTASLLLTGCTVDAQLASQLLSSLQAATKNTSTTGKASISASLSATGSATDSTSADDSVISIDSSTNQAVLTRALQVACGGPGMRIASVQEDTETVAEATAEPTSEPTAEPTSEPTSEPTAEPTDAPVEEVLSSTDDVQPVVVALADPTATPNQKEAKSRRVKIDARLEVELRQLSQFKGTDRDRRYANIQQRYPEMRNAMPVPVQTKNANQRQGNSVQIIFVQMPQMGARPGMAAMPAPAGFRPGGPGQFQSGQAGFQQGYGRPGVGYAPQPRQIPANTAGRVNVSGKAILDGLGNLPCQGFAESASATSDADSSSSDTSSN